MSSSSFRSDSSKRRFLEIAAQKFRSDGIAATGLADIMSDAGLTNGAFYPSSAVSQLRRDASTPSTCCRWRINWPIDSIGNSPIGGRRDVYLRNACWHAATGPDC